MALGKGRDQQVGALLRFGPQSRGLPSDVPPGKSWRASVHWERGLFRSGTLLYTFREVRRLGESKAETDSMEREESVATVTCKACAMFVLLPEIDVAYTCNKCKLVALLEEKVRGLE